MTNKHAGRCDIFVAEGTQQTMMALKRINEAVLPVRYSDEFYQYASTRDCELARLAYFNDVIVGAMLCRVSIDEGVKKLGIMTLGVLRPYRRFGIGRMLLCQAIALAEADPDIECLYLNVQTSNTAAQAFYKLYGFQTVKTRLSYYENIEPPDAYYMELPLNSFCGPCKKKRAEAREQTAQSKSKTIGQSMAAATKPIDVDADAEGVEGTCKHLLSF